MAGKMVGGKEPWMVDSRAASTAVGSAAASECAKAASRVAALELQRAVQSAGWWEHAMAHC